MCPRRKDCTAYLLRIRLIPGPVPPHSPGRRPGSRLSLGTFHGTVAGKARTGPQPRSVEGRRDGQTCGGGYVRCVAAAPGARARAAARGVARQQDASLSDGPGAEVEGEAQKEEETDWSDRHDPDVIGGCWGPAVYREVGSELGRVCGAWGVCMRMVKQRAGVCVQPKQGTCKARRWRNGVCFGPPIEVPSKERTTAAKRGCLRRYTSICIPGTRASTSHQSHGKKGQMSGRQRPVLWRDSTGGGPK